MGQANHHNEPQNGSREIARSLTRARGTRLPAHRSTDASSREVTMGARLFTTVLCLLVSSIQFASAGDAVDAPLPAIVLSTAAATSSVAGAVTGVNAIEPWIHPEMPGSIREKLETAFDIAVDHVATIPECAALFEELDADPFETLKTGLYFPASPARETSVCRRSFAQTYVGEAPTWICRRITSYSDEQAAMVVIHEALHHAGLTERSHDKKAMTSGQINDMVLDRCNLKKSYSGR